MKQPLVTISIPTLNSAAFLERCLGAIDRQTYGNIEVNIVDGGSTDSTKALALKHGVSAFNVYRGALLGARELGARIAKGAIVILLDSDQILEPEAVGGAVEALTNAPYDMLVLEEDVYRQKTLVEKLFHYDRVLVHRVKDFSPFTGVMLPRVYKKALVMDAFSRMPREALERVGGQDHAIIYYEAWQTSQRVKLIPNAVKHIEPDTLAKVWKKFYRWGYTSVDARYGKYNKLLHTKERLRTGLFRKGLVTASLASILLLSLKGVPYALGYCVGKIRRV